MHDLQKQLNEAWLVGREGNLLERLTEVKAIREEPRFFEWAVSYDVQQLEACVRTLAEQMDSETMDAQAAFSPSSAEPFVFTDEQIGVQLDQADLLVQLQERLNSLRTDTVVMPVTIDQPSVTRADLEAHISLRALTYSEVAADSTQSRNENIRLAVEKINGQIIAPGETFDFNAVVGRRTAESGYLEAEEIAYGEGISGIGGGVCQAATAVYQAALSAGLEVTEHHPHVYPADYAPAGQDATVSDQGLNLVFVNQTDYPIYIKARFYETTDAARIEVTIFGAPVDVLCTLESIITEEIAIPEAVRVRDKDQTYVTYIDEEMQVSDGRTGCVAETYRVVYADGVEVSRELAATSTYPPVAPQIYVGTSTRGGE